MRRKRNERQADGADQTAIPYGQGKKFAQELAQRIRDKGMSITARQWKNMGGPNHGRQA